MPGPRYRPPILGARKGAPRPTVTRSGGTSTVTAPPRTSTRTPAVAASDRAVKKVRRTEAALARVRRAYKSAPKAGSTYDPDEAATLIKSVGGTRAEARALSTKVIGESGGDPKAIGDDAAAGYGNTYGLGLWQLTTGVGNDDLIAKHGGPKAMLKPKPNARAALELYRGGGIGNWYAPSNPPGEPGPVSAKPKKKDLKIIRKAGVDPKALKREVSAGSNQKPFAKAAKKAGAVKHPERIVAPKWEKGDDEGHSPTYLAKGISPVVRKWSKKYGAVIGEAKAESGHVSPGHLQTGTATDVYPEDNAWDDPQKLARFEKGLKVLDDAGFEVGYGTDGIGQAWPNHGRGNHAHIEWVGQGTADEAIKKLSGLTDAQLEQIGAGDSSFSGGLGGATSGGTPPGGGGISASRGGTGKKKGPTKKQRLKRVRNAFADEAEATTALSALARKYGSPAV